MSLQVWLPLTKDLRQQGIANTTAISLVSGNALTTGGKVGNQCLALTKLQTILSSTSCMSNKKQMSYAFWVKVNTAWTENWLDGIRWVSTDGSTTLTSRQEFYTNCTKVGTWFQGSSLSGYDFTPGEWTHLAATFDYTAGIAKFYINGALKGTSTALATTHYCRGDFYIGDNGVDIVENDVRIYDHCLSPMEIKQISQGLVLHYPLNREGWGQENLLKNTIVENSHIYNSSSLIYYYFNFSGNLPTGTYTFSFDIKSSNGTDACYFSYANGSSTINRIGELRNIPLDWTHYKYTFTNSASTCNDIFFAHYIAHGGTGTLNANNTGTIYIKNVKLETGNKETSWCPATTDTLYTTMGLNSTTEYDTSGFCNNGTRIGVFSWSSDSSKYMVSQYFEDYTRKLRTPIIFTPTAITMSVWVKSSVTGHGSYHMPLNIDGAHYEFSIGTDGKFRQGFHINGSRIVDTTNSKNLLDGQWHHLCATFDGATIKRYVDGMAVTNGNHSASGTLATTTMLYVGDYGGNETYGNTQMYESDVRIYATALSADDVRALYENSAYIASNGTGYAYEFVEG